MLNHFFTILCNLEDWGNPESHIAPGFVPVVYPSDLAQMMQIILPNVQRDRKIQYGMQLLHWIESVGLSGELLKFDPRTDIDLWNIDSLYYSMPNDGLDLSEWLMSMSGARSRIEEILKRPASFDTSVLEIAWRTHFNPVYAAMAGLIAIMSRVEYERVSK